MISLFLSVVSVQFHHVIMAEIRVHIQMQSTSARTSTSICPVLERHLVCLQALEHHLACFLLPQSSAAPLRLFHQMYPKLDNMASR